MFSRAFRFGLFSLALLCTGMHSQGGLTPYTDKGKTDFDTLLVLLNPYGTWSKMDGSWAYIPLDRQAPYTHGRWLYTEYGWYWKGDSPHSWATEHYGYWKRGADKVWAWYPGSFWLPQTVEIRATPTHIGWRSAAVDQDGNFVEQPLDRYSKPDEWTFVTRAQFANPITPAIIANPELTEQLLDDSTDSMHSYLTYREIDRPGPHPADFVGLSRDGGMFAPHTVEDDLAEQPVPTVVIPRYTPAAKMTGTNAPALLGQDTDESGDKRQVKYWITMSLPSYWTPRPPGAKPQEIYLYRPDIYQDGDGIERRVSLWFNPKSRIRLQDVLVENTPLRKGSAPAATTAAPASPAVPASGESAQAGNPFRSPLDESFHPTSTARPATPASQGPVPSGTNIGAGLPPSP